MQEVKKELKSRLWIEEWKEEKYHQEKVLNFNLVNNYLEVKNINLDKKPYNVLDIGCGMAMESEMLQKRRPNTYLYLLDGDFMENKRSNIPKELRDGRYGTIESFVFYSKIKDLQEDFENRGMKFTFLPISKENKLSIAKSLKFDLIYSFLSAGFHYPVVFYKKLCQINSTNDTLFIFDIRKDNYREQAEHFDVKDLIRETDKFVTLSLKFKK